MPINWQDPVVRDRLLAAIIGSFDSTINCREVARLFGQDATYNAIENFLRKPKQEAKKLRAEAAGTTGPAPSPAKKVTTPKKSSGSVLDGVKSGRVSKKAPNGTGGVKASPAKKETLMNMQLDNTDDGAEKISAAELAEDVDIDDLLDSDYA